MTQITWISEHATPNKRGQLWQLWFACTCGHGR